MTVYHSTGRSKNRWEHFPHDADIGVRGFGDTLAAAFEQAALALVGVVADLETIQSVTTVDIHCAAPNVELLFVDWLNAIVYEMDTRRMLFSEFHAQIGDNGLQLNGWARGEAISEVRHKPAAEVKGATFSELQVVRAGDGTWRAQCIVDV